MGGSWQLFFKHSPSLQIVFFNPAIQALEPTPMPDLSNDAQQAVKRYCQIRFGLENIEQCYKQMQNLRI